MPKYLFWGSQKQKKSDTSILVGFVNKRKTPIQLHLYGSVS
jgi:hypothetical protein